jgi:Zn-dependent protease
MSFDDERWKQKRFEAPHPTEAPGSGVPAGVVWAGVIWTAIGAFQLLVIVGLYLRTGVVSSVGPLIGAVLFLKAGRGAMFGTTPGTVRSGIFSVLLGFVWVAVGVLSAQTFGSQANGWLLVLIGGVLGGALVLAGVMAVSAGPSYQRWRDANLGRQ